MQWPLPRARLAGRLTGAEPLQAAEGPGDDLAEHVLRELLPTHEAMTLEQTATKSRRPERKADWHGFELAADHITS